MPHPIWDVRRNAGFVSAMSGVQPHRERPASAALALSAIASWSNVEMHQVNLYDSLARQLSNNPRRKFAGARTAAGKLALLMVAAKQALEPEHLRVWRSVRVVTERRARDCHKLSHWVWGISAELPDALLLTDPRELSFDASCHASIFQERIEKATFV